MIVLNVANECCILDVRLGNVIVIDGENSANLKMECAINDVVSFFTFEMEATSAIEVLNKIAQLDMTLLSRDPAYNK